MSYPSPLSTLYLAGYDAPPSLSPYAAYLDERIRAFRELKHDVIRSAEGSRARSNGGDGANRLRKLRVEKGLLREVSISQRVLSRLLDCSFFQDNLSDDLNIGAFRMVLKDVLAIYTAINEGVINILEHYFEMSHPDASRALDIYKRFCRHTEKVVAYLNAARKASYSLNMTVPQLKHAPVSLAGALEEYLNDPAFEKNRQEYKESKRVADGLPPSASSTSSAAAAKPEEKKEEKKKVSIQEPSAEEKTRPPKPPTGNQAIQDFFSTLESEMPEQNGASQFSMAPQATGMAWFGSPNPSMFMSPGMPSGSMGPPMGMQPQMTGYNPFLAPGGGMGMQPQQTAMGFQPTGMGMMSPDPGQQQQNAFLQPQATAMPGNSFLAPQATGFNPFRQSMMQPTGSGSMMPQVTGMGPTGAFDATPFTEQVKLQMQMQRLQREREGQGQQNSEANNQSSTDTFTSPPPVQQPQSPPPKPLLAQKTGSRNPFAPPPGEKPPTPPPSVPKGPTLTELAMGTGSGLSGPTASGGGSYGLGAGAWDRNQNNASPAQPQQQQGQFGSSGLVPQKTGLLGSVASEFTSAGRTASPANGQGPSSLASSAAPLSPSIGGSGGYSGAGSSLQALSTGFSAFSIGGSSNTNSTGLTSPSLQPQPTGFAGSSIRPFKPESSFGASLAAQHTGIPASQPQGQSSSNNPFGLPQPGTPGGSSGSALFGSSLGTSQGGGQGSNVSAPQGQTIGAGSSLFAPQSNNSSGPANGSGFGGLTNGSGNVNSNGTGSPFPSHGVTSQPTGFGSSLFNTSFSNTNSQQQQPLQSQPTGFAGSSVKPFQPTSAFGSAAFGGGANQQQPGQGQGQTPTGSLF